jgi:hypothetical protein
MSVEQMIKGVRNILLDKIRPYRYSDVSLIAALNITLLDARRIRPDLFIDRYGIEIPQYEEVSGAIIPIEAQFRLPIEYGIAGHALLRDEEDIQDSRANTFILNYINMLTGQRPHVSVEGGTPSPRSKPRGGGPQPPGGE